ncbi:MAG: nucleotidyltransferase family protein [Rhodanobacteraceae bacterium]|nr:nucleotidyltransferase family protein [Rhodanobacteraceae bacterium]MBP9155894.1 nucleotidyltransferase family protein [Xanthomonadales bacterium]
MTSREQLARWLAVVPAPTPVSLEHWLDAGREEGIDTLLAAHWQTSNNLSAVDRAACNETIQRAHARELHFQAHERSALSALQLAGIDVLVLKGAALARWLYPSPHLRTRSDLDLLLQSEADFNRCRNALLVLGYEDRDAPLLPPCYERALRKRVGMGEHCVDVHWRLSNHPAFAQCFTFMELWAERQPLSGLPDSWGLSPVHAMIHACLHRACNLTEAAGDRLIWLYDIALLAMRLSEVEWSSLLSLASRFHISEPCRHTLVAARCLFDSPIPEAVIQELTVTASVEVFRMDRAHQLGYRSYWAFRMLPWSERVPWLWRKMFPDWRFMQAHFGLTHFGQLPSAYARRMLRLLVATMRRR